MTLSSLEITCFEEWHRTAIRQLASVLGIRPASWTILEVAASLSGRDASAARLGTVRRQCGLNAPRVSEALAELQQNKLVHVYSDARDRRRLLVGITEQGFAAHRLMLERMDGPVCRADAWLDVRRQARLRFGLSPLALRILLLAHEEGSVCVAESTRMLKAPQASVSTAVSLLRHKGLVEPEGALSTDRRARYFRPSGRGERLLTLIERLLLSKTPENASRV